ncbi:MAG: hypothetical protein ACI9RM_001084 [Ulvibacter sp.]|jgi:hypothetical protein
MIMPSIVGTPHVLKAEMSADQNPDKKNKERK